MHFFRFTVAVAVVFVVSITFSLSLVSCRGRGRGHVINGKGKKKQIFFRFVVYHIKFLARTLYQSHLRKHPFLVDLGESVMSNELN